MQTYKRNKFKTQKPCVLVFGRWDLAITPLGASERKTQFLGLMCSTEIALNINFISVFPVYFESQIPALSERMLVFLYSDGLNQLFIL